MGLFSVRAAAVPVLSGVVAALYLGASPAATGASGAAALALFALASLGAAQGSGARGSRRCLAEKYPTWAWQLNSAATARKLLQRLAAESGDAAPAFTAYIAGQRMTFVKNPLHFSSVLKEGRRRLQFRPVATKIMQQAFDCTTADMDGEAYAGWQKLSPKQWSMLRGKPLLELMSRTQEELVDALCDQKSESGSTDDLYGTVVDLMWRATGAILFLAPCLTMTKSNETRPTRRLLGTPTMGL